VVRVLQEKPPSSTSTYRFGLAIPEPAGFRASAQGDERGGCSGFLELLCNLAELALLPRASRQERLPASGMRQLALAARG